MVRLGARSMILIRNRQRSFPVDISLLKSDVERVLAALNYADFDVNIIITTNATIKKYNKKYRNKDKATNILSFSYHADVPAGKRIKVYTEDDKNLGDLILSAEYITKEAADLGISFCDRLRILIVHGICHLLGYDHIEDADWHRMRAKEAFLLKKLRS